MAKGYRKVFTIKREWNKAPELHQRDGHATEINPDYTLYSQIVDAERYKICIKYRTQCFFIVDLLSRKLELDTMSFRKAKNTIGVIPEGEKSRFKLKGTKEKISGFVFVRTKVEEHDIYETVGNLLRISLDGSLSVHINTDRRKSRCRQISLKVKRLPKENEQGGGGEEN